jgi:hypothetical protein
MKRGIDYPLRLIELNRLHPEHLTAWYHENSKMFPSVYWAKEEARKELMSILNERYQLEQSYKDYGIAEELDIKEWEELPSSIHALKDLASNVEGLNAVELYVVSNGHAVRNFYYFDFRRSKLVTLRTCPDSFLRDALVHSPQEEMDSAIIVTANLDRGMLLYGERGYRAVLLQAGRMVEKITTRWERENIPHLYHVEFFDDRLHERMGIDGFYEAAFAVLTVFK